MPCPGALVVLLTAISLHRLALGLGLLVVYSLGLATVISGLGVLFILGRRRFDRLSFDGRLTRVLPVVSSAAILVLGAGRALRPLWS